MPAENQQHSSSENFYIADI